MMSAVARFFRLINAKLITTDNVVAEKVLKVFFALSIFIYRRAAKDKGGSKKVIVDFDSTVKMKIDPSRSIGSAIYWTGYHEFREFLFLHRYLKSDMVFVDIGANQGEYTLFAAKRLTAGRVLAFEPLPSIRKVLHENIHLNSFKNIEVYDCGLSDREGVLPIHEVEDEHEGLATLYPGDRASRSSIAVELKTLDAIFPATGLKRLDFIKIDIEGAELSALQGSKKVLEMYKPSVMIEINAITYATAGYTPDDVRRFFDDLKYQAFETRKRGTLRKCTDLPSFGNIVFIPR
jgi:FkbM family methyltransferase